MLKIKDDVDLKELGFEKEDDDFIYQDDVELLARCLYRQGLINRTETEYINPIKDDDNYLTFKKIEIVEE